MNNMRIGGLATGMDLEGLVKDMMKVQQAKADKMAQQKTRTQWQQEAYQDVNKTFANFILDTQKSFGLIKIGSAGFSKQSVDSLDWVKNAMSNDQDIMTAKARADAVAGTYSLNVKQLATNWSAASAGSIAPTISLGTDETIDFTIEANGKQVTIQKSGPGEFKLADIAKEINQAGIGVSAHYDAGVGRFFLQTEKTGESSTIKITDNSTIEGGFIAGANSFLKLNHQVGDNDLAIESEQTYHGQNALVDFGAAKDLEFANNQFTLNNIEFNIKSIGETTVTVNTDVDGVYDKIIDFVAQYNMILDQVNGLLGARDNRSYQPLTPEQREQLSEKEIEKWEEKAKSGLLYRDSYLSNTVQQMRSGLYEGVQGSAEKLHLTSFGITTEKYVAGSMGGKLVVDEIALKNAIREDVDSVLELLFAQPDKSVTDKKEQRAQTGIVSRIYSDLTDGMKQIINKAGPGEDAGLYRNVDSRMLLDFVVDQGSISYLQKDISKMNDRISSFEAQMQRLENRYWNQFTAMEKAIGKMNSQAAWLAQQFGGGQ